MADFSGSLKVLSSAMEAQGQRIRHISENISNADTPGYRRKTISFNEVYEFGRPTGLVETSQVRLDSSEVKYTYDPGHPLADDRGMVESSNVNLILEIADAREAQRSYEASLKMFEQTRRMSSQLYDLLRR